MRLIVSAWKYKRVASGIVFAYPNFNRVGDDEPTVVNSWTSGGRRSGPMWYILGVMIVASVGYGLHKVLSRRKGEAFGEPHSYLLR